jgi:hypothetical protein
MVQPDFNPFASDLACLRLARLLGGGPIEGCELSLPRCGCEMRSHQTTVPIRPLRLIEPAKEGHCLGVELGRGFVASGGSLVGGCCMSIDRLSAAIQGF